MGYHVSSNRSFLLQCDWYVSFRVYLCWDLYLFNNEELKYYYMVVLEFYLTSSFSFSPWSSNLLDPVGFLLMNALRVLVKESIKWKFVLRI